MRLSLHERRASAMTTTASNAEASNALTHTLVWCATRSDAVKRGFTTARFQSSFKDAAMSIRKICDMRFNASRGDKSRTLSWTNTTFVGQGNVLLCCTPQSNEVLGTQQRQFHPRALTESQGKLVKTAWDVLRKDADRHGLSLFLKVFEIAPSTKRLFSFLQDTNVPLAKNPHLKSHALLVFTLTCEAAVSLGSKGEVKTPGSTMRDMGLTHLKHHVMDEHFDVLKYALLKTLEGGLPSEMWTEEMRVAWVEAYDELVAAIQAQMKAEALSATVGAAGSSNNAKPMP